MVAIVLFVVSSVLVTLSQGDPPPNVVDPARGIYIDNSKGTFKGKGNGQYHPGGFAVSKVYGRSPSGSFRKPGAGNSGSRNGNGNPTYVNDKVYVGNGMGSVINGVYQPVPESTVVDDNKKQGTGGAQDTGSGSSSDPTTKLLNGMSGTEDWNGMTVNGRPVNNDQELAEAMNGGNFVSKGPGRQTFRGAKINTGPVFHGNNNNGGVEEGVTNNYIPDTPASQNPDTGSEDHTGDRPPSVIGSKGKVVINNLGGNFQGKGNGQVHYGDFKASKVDGTPPGGTFRKTGAGNSGSRNGNGKRPSVINNNGVYVGNNLAGIVEDQEDSEDSGSDSYSDPSNGFENGRTSTPDWNGMKVNGKPVKNEQDLTGALKGANVNKAPGRQAFRGAKINTGPVFRGNNNNGGVEEGVTNNYIPDTPASQSPGTGSDDLTESTPLKDCQLLEKQRVVVMNGDTSGFIETPKLSNAKSGKRLHYLATVMHDDNCCFNHIALILDFEKVFKEVKIPCTVLTKRVQKYSRILDGLWFNYAGLMFENSNSVTFVVGGGKCKRVFFVNPGLVEDVGQGECEKLKAQPRNPAADLDEQKPLKPSYSFPITGNGNINYAGPVSSGVGSLHTVGDNGRPPVVVQATPGGGVSGVFNNNGGTQDFSGRVFNIGQGSGDRVYGGNGVAKPLVQGSTAPSDPPISLVGGVSGTQDWTGATVNGKPVKSAQDLAKLAKGGSFVKKGPGRQTFRGAKINTGPVYRRNNNNGGVKVDAENNYSEDESFRGAKKNARPNGGVFTGNNNNGGVQKGITNNYIPYRQSSKAGSWNKAPSKSFNSNF